MTPDQRRKAYREADEALRAARDEPDVIKRRRAVFDNIAARIAAAPRSDNQGRIVPDAPTGGEAA